MITTRKFGGSIDRGIGKLMKELADLRRRVELLESGASGRQEQPAKSAPASGRKRGAVDAKV